MNRIDDKFTALKKNNKKAFIAYVMAGDPDLKATKKIVLELDRSGADIVEIGIPFSDPLADGPVIQAAAQRALRSGTNISKVLDLVAGLRRFTDIPLVAMTYYNLIFCYGVERFVKDAVKKGLDGIIVPDLPPEEAADLIGVAKQYGFHLIFLLAPTSTLKRVKIVNRFSRGFIYYVSVTGVTGVRDNLPADILRSLKIIKKNITMPLCVGFGISRASQLALIRNAASGVIVGSALVNIINQNRKSGPCLKKIRGFVRGMQRVLNP